MFATKDMHTELLACVATALDQLDQWECAPKVVSTCVAVTLMTLGYPKIESYAASIQNLSALELIFSETYWQSREVSHRMQTLMAAVHVAAKSIEEGSIDEKVKQITKETIEKEQTT